VLAALALRVLPHMGLFETTIDDVKFASDYFAPLPKLDSLGFRVLIK
jgi:hypothetical protein